MKLETLNGAEMPNFINGSWLKKYKQLLKNHMLQQLHKAKNFKEGQARLKDDAQ